jgi:2-polyprenyl-3-methyl-5-hydroxy-6-metoxy-1,4-benzoquinol methylase
LSTPEPETRMSDPERYWNRAGEVSYAEKMYGSRDVERHVRLGTWNVALDIAKEIGIPEKGRVLDLGCGDGAFANHSLRNYGRVDGYDLAPAAIERARKEAPGEHYHYQTADLINFDYGLMPHYDGVFMMGILHHIKQATPSILAKVARQTNRIVVLEPNGDNLMRKALELTPAYRKAGEDSFGTKELQRIFKEAGFETRVWRRINLFPNFTPAFIYKLLASIEPHVEKNAVLRSLCTVNMFGFVRAADGKAN